MQKIINEMKKDTNKLIELNVQMQESNRLMLELSDRIMQILEGECK